MVEKIMNMYVIANADTGMYIRSLGNNGKYAYTNDITSATKTLGVKTAQTLMRILRRENSILISEELVIVPVRITYELIDESENNKYAC